MIRFAIQINLLNIDIIFTIIRCFNSKHFTTTHFHFYLFKTRTAECKHTVRRIHLIESHSRKEIPCRHLSTVFVSAKTGREIKTTIFNSFGVSAKLGGMAVLVALISGVVLGSIAALTRNRLPDRLIIFFSTLFTSLPSFVLGTLLLLVFCIRLKWIPVWSSSSQNYVLPVIALAAYPMAYITRLTKTSMLDALGQDYVRTARAKGVAQWKVIFKHTLRNALIPVITYVGPMTASILTGSLVVESIFTIGGLGSKFVECITNRDYPMIMGTTIFLATLMVTMTLITDIVYKLIDPRITLE